METPFPCDPVHLQLFFRQLKPHADIAAKLETMKLFSSFFLFVFLGNMLTTLAVFVFVWRQMSNAQVRWEWSCDW